LARTKGDFLFGDFTIADCMYAPVVSRFDTFGVPVSEEVRAYMDRILALPAMKAWRRGAEEEIAAGIAASV
jgi:glutathione S-transferase